MSGPSGLIRRFPMDDDGSGDVSLLDALGSGNNLSVVYGSGPTLETGFKGGAAQVTAGNGYFSYACPSGTTAKAISVNKDAATTFNAVISRAGNDSALWYGRGSSDEERMRIYNDSGEVTFPATDFPIQTWHRVLWAVAGGSSYLVVDGVVAGSGADTEGFTATTWAVLGRQSSEANEFLGRGDEFCIYNRSLANQTEVEALAAEDLAFAIGDPKAINRSINRATDRAAS